MRLVELHVQGYRSLYDVHFVPGEMSVLVGPNNAGKTNFVEALDFLAETYRHGLEVAINRKGGIENITHRKMRRTRLDLAFDVTTSLHQDELPRYYVESGPSGDRARDIREILVRHRFAFHSLGQAIEAEYRVVSELFSVTAVRENDRRVDVLTVTRTNGSTDFEVPPKLPRALRFLVQPFHFKDFREFFLDREVPPGRLLQDAMPYSPAIQSASNGLARTRMYQLVTLCRRYVACSSSRSKRRKLRELAAIVRSSARSRTRDRRSPGRRW